MIFEPRNSGVDERLADVLMPGGNSKSPPADDSGVTDFRNLLLTDALPGTCFRLQFFFSPRSAADNAIATALGYSLSDLDTQLPDVTATSDTVFCAVNERRPAAAFVRQTDVKLSAGSTLTAPPTFRVSQPLPSFTAVTGRTLYFLPMAATMGFSQMRLLPQALDTIATHPDLRVRLGLGNLRGNDCMFLAGNPITGGCSVHNQGGPDPFTQEFVTVADATPHWNSASWAPHNLSAAEVAYAANNFHYFGTPLLFTADTPAIAPTMVSTIRFDLFEWDPTSSDQLRPSMQVAVSSTSSTAASPAAVFPEMVLERTPASIDILTIPPTTVVVGVPFVMQVAVYISSGSALSGINVNAQVTPATGTVLSPLEYIRDSYRIESPSQDNEPPVLISSSITALTNGYGIARFVLTFQSGSTGDRSTLTFRSAAVQSRRTQAFTLLNAVAAINASAADGGEFSFNRTGLDGVGNPNTEEARVHHRREGFPVAVPLPDLVLQPAFSTSDRRVLAIDPVWLAQSVAFRTFSTVQLEQMAQQQANLQTIADNRGVSIESLTSAATSLASNLNAAREADANASPIELLSGAAASTQLDPVQELLLRQLAEDLLSQSTGPGALSNFIQIFTSGTAPQVATPAPSRNAQVEPDYNVTVQPDGSLLVSGLSLYVRTPGHYRLQPLVGGIAGSVVGDFNIRRYNTTTPLAIAMRYLFQIAMAVFFITMGVGNSDYHKPFPTALPVAVTFIAVGFVLVFVIDYPIGDPLDIGTWWIVCFSFLLVGTLVGTAGFYCGSRVKALQPFADQRREQYFAYCRRLVRGPVHARGILQREYRLADDKGDLKLEDRMAYEAAIVSTEASERSVVFQLKEIVRSLRHGNVDAVHLPARMWGAFCISVFTTFFVAISVSRLFMDFRDTVIAADVSTAKAMYAGLGTLQTQFVVLAGDDLPGVASNWILANSDSLHYYLVSLAQAIVTASIVGQTFGIIFYVLAWISLCADFRAQVLQARRGIWQFNQKKVKIKLSMAFVGTQVSNGILTFILVSTVFGLIAVMFAWRLTSDIITWYLTTQYAVLIGILAPILFNVLLNLLIKKTIILDRTSIRHRCAH